MTKNFPNTQEIKKNNNYIINYDDSSDEEDDNDALKDDLTFTYNNFKEKEKNDNNENRFIYSFLNYCLGMMIYNSGKVKEYYRSLKENYLKNEELPSDEIVKEWVEVSLLQAIKTEVPINKHKKAFDKLFENCTKSLEKEINTLVNECLNNKRKLIYIIRYDKIKENLPKSIQQELRNLMQKLVELLNDSNLLMYQNISKNDFDLPLRVTTGNLLKVKEIKEKLEHKYKDALKEINIVHSWTINNQFNNMSLLTDIKKWISSSAKTKGNCKRILNEYKLTIHKKFYITEIKKLESKEDPDIFLKNVKTKILKNKLAQQIENSKNILINGHIEQEEDIKNSQLKEFEDDLDAFILCNNRRFQEIIKENIEYINISNSFIGKLNNNFQKYLEPHTLRTTLSTAFTHQIKSSLEYISSLRLTNRSATRTIRNQQQEDSILGNSKETNQDFSWQLPASKDSIAIERTRLTNKARSGVVFIQTNENSYEKLIEQIESLKKNAKYNYNNEIKNITDRDIALWVRQIIQCKVLDFPICISPDKKILFKAKQRKDLTLFLIQFAHLIIGTESMRYPGALVENQMALDLIIEGKLTWEDALTKDDQKIFIPMIIKEAVQSTRGLSTSFYKYSKYKHNYPGDKKDIYDNNTCSFVNAESRLSKSWVSLVVNQKSKSSESSVEKTSSQKIENEENNINYMDYIDLVKNSINKWYPGIS